MNDQELNDLMRDYAAELAAYKRLPQSTCRNRTCAAGPPPPTAMDRVRG